MEPNPPNERSIWTTLSPFLTAVGVALLVMGPMIDHNRKKYGQVATPVMPFTIPIGIGMLVLASRGSDRRRSKDVRPCASCGGSNPQAARFCRQCGKSMG
jgi:hypothetical protein